MSILEKSFFAINIRIAKETFSIIFVICHYPHNFKLPC